MSELTQTITSPTGKKLAFKGTHKTTPKESSEAKAVRIKTSQNERLERNRASLTNKNVKAFLQAIAAAEGGGYDFKYGAIKGKKNDPWRFTDFSTHPGPGFGGSTTASGMYQITKDTWQDHAVKAMGLTDFKPETQDLIAVDMLSSMGVLDNIQDGDVAGAMPKAARRWAALPQGPGLSNRYPPQPYVKYEQFVESYKGFGGDLK